MQIQDLYKIFLLNASIQTDTRKLQKGDMFFALKGENFNGNKFAQQAIDAGASYVIVDESVGFENDKIIKTDNCLKTLQELAKYHRQQLLIPFLAITGSNGKTTTKELIHEVLSTSFRTYTTKGNLNNHIGIPLTILSVKKEAEIAVIEMGANHLKEIEGYCEYTLPTHGLITNCGKAHLEGFGGEDGVKKAKGELFDHLRKHGGTAFIMNDYDYLKQMSAGIDVIKTYGALSDAEITGAAIKSKEFLGVEITKGLQINYIQTNLVGDYNLPNVLAAVAVGKYFNVDEEKIKNALEGYIPSNSRSQLIEKNGNRIILDAYNANPSSMKAAIENFAKVNTNEKVLMLGAMMELGKGSIGEHQALVNLIQNYSWKNVVLVGGDYIHSKHPFVYFADSTEAKKWMAQQHFSGVSILVKGSRSMQMEKVIED